MVALRQKKDYTTPYSQIEWKSSSVYTIRTAIPHVGVTIKNFVFPLTLKVETPFDKELFAL
jgi:hypothetical protein